MPLGNGPLINCPSCGAGKEHFRCEAYYSADTIMNSVGEPAWMSCSRCGFIATGAMEIGIRISHSMIDEKKSKKLKKQKDNFDGDVEKLFDKTERIVQRNLYTKYLFCEDSQKEHYIFEDDCDDEDNGE